MNDEGLDIESTYRTAAASGDIDALHDVIASKGIDILARGVPYLIVAARNRRRDALRHQGVEDRYVRRQKAAHVDVDPVDRIFAAAQLNLLLASLGNWPDHDALLLWWSAADVPDSEIIDRLRPFGIEIDSRSTLRKRRERLRRKLKRELARTG